MSPSATDHCPQCGAGLAAGAFQAPCPACLMQLGLQAAQDTPEENAGVIPELGPTHISPLQNWALPTANKLPSPQDLARLFPELEIIKLLGFGGMGAVYQARQTGLDRFVALKIIMPDVAGDPGFAERFTREARVLARLSHPHIVTIHDFGQRAGLHFLVMEYVDGVNLREVLNTGRMSPAEALRIIPRLCEALQYAHEEGVVHRDIKPENILIDRKGRVKVADFGLARLAGRDSENFTLTGTRQVVGTPRYMAPEQMQGARAVDHRADIYSLGVVFYEMLTGEVPLGRFPPPSHQAEIDVRLDDVVLRALDSNPDRRYQRVSEIQSDVESISREGYVAPSLPAASEVQPASDATLPAVFQLVIASIQILLSFGMMTITLAQLRPGDMLITIVLVIVTSLSGIAGLAAIAGAVHYIASGSVRWLRIGAILLLVPTNIAWVIGLPVGLWVLISTGSHRRVRHVPQPRPTSNPRSTQLQVIAILQLIVGFLEFVSVPLVFWFFLAGPAGDDPDQGMAMQKVFMVGMVFLGVLGGAKVVSAIGYLSGGSYKWLWVGAVLMLMPIGITSGLAIPVGIWALYALYRESQRPPVAAAVQEVPIPPLPPPLPTVLTPSPGTSAAAPISQQMSAPWSGLGWVQKAVRRVPKRKRWPWFVGSVLALLVVWVVLLAISTGNLISAAKSSSTTGTRFWVLIGSNVNAQDKEGMTPLMWAAWNSKPDIVRQLLAAGADFHLRANDGETALMKACYVGHNEIVDQLLKAGAIVNDNDYDGESPLALAATKGHVAIVQKLLQAQADPRVRTKGGWTPLIAAATNGHGSVVSMLLPVSSIDAIDDRGRTALMKAATYGYQDCVQSLVDAHADLNLISADGHTALSLAIAEGHTAVVDLLARKGAAANALLPFFQGFRAVRHGQIEPGLKWLLEASGKLSSAPYPWRVTIDGVAYEIQSPQYFVQMLIAECHIRQRNFELAKAAMQTAAGNMAPGTQAISLYRRKVVQPGYTLTEQVNVMAGEITAHVAEPGKTWHFLREAEERTETPGRSGGSTTSGGYDVKSLLE